MNVCHLDDYRPFDAGTPTRCYDCGTSRNVVKNLGDGGYVWACPNCGHPAD